MFTRKLIRYSLGFAFTLTLAGIASARRPPSLEHAQENSARAFATCAESLKPGTLGYRDMLARTSEPSAVAHQVAAIPPRKMGDHLVLVCPGGEIHQGSGYRDFPARLWTDTSRPQMAATPRLVGRR